MKTRFLAYRLTILAVAICCCIVFAQESERAKILFHRGLHLEEVKGELEPAITVYQQVLEDFPSDRSVSARSQLHIGICYEKLGKEKAVNAYQRVVAEYGDQREVVVEARKRLEKLESMDLQVNPAAREAYIMANYYREMTRGTLQSVKYYKQAITFDSTFAPAYVDLARAYVFGNELGIPRETVPIAEKNVLKALELDNNLADAHTVLAMIRMYYDWDWEEAEREFKRALELNPESPDAHEQYSFYLACMGQMEEAILEMKRALSLDPVNRWANSDLGRMYFFNRDYDRAMEQYRKTIELQPHRAVIHVLISSVFHQKRMYEDAVQSGRKYLLMLGDTTLAEIVGTTFAESGYENALRIWAEHWEPFTEDGSVQASTIALIYANIDNKDKAFEWLQKGYEMRSREMTRIGIRPEFDGLRSDERFKELLDKIGLPN